VCADAEDEVVLTPTLYSYCILFISGSPRIRASCHGLGIPGRVRAWVSYNERALFLSLARSTKPKYQEFLLPLAPAAYGSNAEKIRF